MRTPDKPLGMDRRNFLRLCGISAAGAAFGLSCTPDRSQPPIPTTNPTKKPTIASTKAPTPEPLDSQLIEKAQQEILDLSYYSLNTRETMANFWLQGQPGVVGYQRNNQAFSMQFEPAKPDRAMDDLAITGVTLGRRNIASGGSALVFYIRGSYYSRLGENLPEKIKQRLDIMNFQNEAIMTLTLCLGLANIGRELGLDFNFPSEKVTQENQKLARLQEYLPAVRSFGEAVAEANDYILTAPLLDKDPQGQILYVRPPYNQKPMPTISGLLFPDNGLTYIVDQTIGPSLKEVNSLDELAQKYPLLGTIPGSAEYLRQIEQHFRNNP